MSSLLNDTNPLLNAANSILQCPKIIVEGIYGNWSIAFDLLHRDPIERQELLNIIGNKGVELFQLNNTITNFMLTQLSGVRNDVVEQIQTRLASLPEFVFNEDGTVTEVVPPLSSTETVELSSTETVELSSTETVELSS